MELHKHFGCTRDIPDPRDHSYDPDPALLKAPPKSVDLRPHCPPVYDQRPLQSCTANATAAAIHFERRRLKLDPDFVPSRLFIYYNERKLTGRLDQDAGASLRSAIKSVARFGDCPEPVWPYEPDKVAVPPTPRCYDMAVRYRNVAYQRVKQELPHLKACLAAGQPFVFTFGVYAGFESPEAAKTCTVPVPKPDEKFEGNHAVMAVGYDDKSQRFWLRNSWGPHWAEGGYFQMPYTYIENPRLSGDFWTLQLIVS